MATPTESATLRALQAYALLTGESRSVDVGVAYTSRRYSRLDEANQVREVIVESPGEVAAAYERVERYFAERGLKCHRWALAVDQRSEELERFLAEQGFVRERFTVMRVAEWVDLPLDEAIRVLPARAMRKALDRVLHDAYAGADEPVREKLIEAAVERLDDARVEGCVAMVSGEPAGYCTFFEVGDIGYLSDLFVVGSHRRAGVGRALMGHVLSLAKRLLMRITCLRVREDNAAARALFERCGLEADGSITEFVARRRA